MNPPIAKKAVYTVVKSQSGGAIYMRLGWAHTNPDGSIAVFLDALPVNGRLHIRDFSPDSNPQPPDGD